MFFERASGILLHPTSLPGPFGIGDMGEAAFQFIDFLKACGQRYWQVLPLGHTGYGDSPYQSFSAFAGNPLLLSLEILAKKKLVLQSEIEAFPEFSEGRVDFGGVIPAKLSILKRASKRFHDSISQKDKDEYHQFWLHNSWWLDDYALFIALKDHFNGAVWTQWETGLVQRDPDTLCHWRNVLHDAVEAIKTWQYFFMQQWGDVKRYANRRGMQIIGDIPIYVAHDSVDVWANQYLFQLDEHGEPIVVAGVPPDYFSETGQLWGNPIYRWDVARAQGYSWWTARFRDTFKQVDIVRLDHFRGFQAYWQVPGGDETAINGEWIDGPGAALFDHLRHEFGGELPIIAENLGVITEDVENLRKRYGLPGMAILQFAFGGDAECGDLPHNYPNDIVAYSGTHDNDTTVAWWNSTGGEDSTRTAEEIAAEKTYAAKYLNTQGKEIQWDCIRALMASVANTVVTPVQDLLGLDGKARMNFPGRPYGNWQWRLKPGQLTDEIHARLLEMTELYGRAPRKTKKLKDK